MPASKISSGGTRESLQPRIVERLLTTGELGEDLLPYGRKPGRTLRETYVPGDQALEGLVRRVPAANVLG